MRGEGSASQRVAHLWGRVRREATVVRSVRAAGAATLAYVVAQHVSDTPAPLTAPLTALLTVQVTLYATLTTGVRRVNAVIAGVLVAIGFSALVGLTWWSLGLLILAALVVGHLVRVSEFVPEVAISAMLVLGVSRVTDTAWDRVLETVIGAAVGLLVNVVLAPPVWTGTAGDALEDLARRMRRLLLRIGEELSSSDVREARATLQEARDLDRDIAEVDAALRQAEESLRFNPRVREGLLNRVVLRTGLDTLEICTVVLRVLARTFTDLARVRESEDTAALFEPKAARAVENLLAQVADAIVSFSVLVTHPVSESAEAAEDRLAAELHAARRERARVGTLLRESARTEDGHWYLYGALLTEVDRILAELDLEQRSQRLLDELDRNAREQRERHPLLTRARTSLTRRSGRGPRLPSQRGGAARGRKARAEAAGRDGV
ncbi:aromatic acid exporter family protein [Streptomyces sp. NPDC047046]|uniref:aromatic acid exporter family protein n=1 Tax=Streptomyces sp. NPDC047046 TaxID=3155378 RepID=UPI0033DE982D